MAENTSNLVTTLQRHNYISALSRVFALQNKDGSWGGRNIEERTILTSQAIQLMHALGIPSSDNAMFKAIGWMKGLKTGHSHHWASRLEVGLILGNNSTLVNKQDIDDFINDVQQDMSSNKQQNNFELFWDVIPTLIALYPYESDYGITVPHEEVIKCIDPYIRSLENGYMIVNGKANHTGLIALYLHTISQNEKYSGHRDKVNKMVEHLLSIIEAEDDNSKHWSRGRGTISYILMDLIICTPESDKARLRSCITKALTYLSPDEKGRVEADVNTTYETESHRNPLYVTLLVLRAMTEVMKQKKDEDLNKIVDEARTLKPHVKIKRIFSFSKKIMDIILCITLIFISIILINKNGCDQYGYSIFSAAIGCAAGIIINDASNGLPRLRAILEYFKRLLIRLLRKKEA